MTPIANIHATCIRLATAGRAFAAPSSAGVLLVGESGSGKSDLALRLIERGAQLVSDDRTELFVERGRLWGRAPARIAGLIEIRGVGIIKLRHTARVRLALVVALGRTPSRIPERATWLPPKSLGIAPSLPLIEMNAFDAAAPARIAAATAAFSRRLFRESVKRQ